MRRAMVIGVMLAGCTAARFECVVGLDCICPDGERYGAACVAASYDQAVCEEGRVGDPGCGPEDLYTATCRDGEPVPCREGFVYVCTPCP